MMVLPLVLRQILTDETYYRLLVGTVLAFVAFQLQQQLSPFASVSLTAIANIGNLQVFLIYFWSMVLVNPLSEPFVAPSP